MPGTDFVGLDGTLLDDVDLCVDALNRLLAGFGYPQRYDHERYRAIFGFPIEEYYVRAGFDFTKHSFAELAEKYMEDYVPASAACPLADGAIDALEALRPRGCGRSFCRPAIWTRCGVRPTSAA